MGRGSPEEIEAVIRKHGLKRRPDINIPQGLLEEKNGLGVFLNPNEGKEIMTQFHDPRRWAEQEGRRRVWGRRGCHPWVLRVACH